MPTHQPDQDVFRSALPEDIDWPPFAAFPPSARLAVDTLAPGHNVDGLAIQSV